MQASKKSMHDADLYCETKGKHSETIYQWTIHNFSLMRNVDSPIFSSKECDEVKWRLSAYTNWNSSNKYLSLYITLVSNNNVNAKVKFLMLQDNKKVEPIKSREVIEFRYLIRWGHEKFKSHDNLLESANGYLPNDKLTIICKINVLLNITTRVEMVAELNNGNSSMIKVPKCNLKDDLGNLLEKELLCDVILAVGEYEYKAHKAILAIRSSVFAAMFEHEMVERKHNRVVITDVKPLVLKEMLHFIYKGKSPNIKSMTQELLAAADKYALLKLKAMCEKELFANLSIDNAAEILAFADQHSAGQLKTETLHFININRSGVIKSVGWKNLLESNLHLMLEVLTSINLY